MYVSVQIKVVLQSEHSQLQTEIKKKDFICSPLCAFSSYFLPPSRVTTLNFQVSFVCFI